MDVLVRWDRGGTNVVSSTDLKLVDSKELQKGGKVKMLWYEEWWFGKIEDMQDPLINMEVGSDSSVDSDDDNIPLAKFPKRTKGNDERTKQDDPRETVRRTKGDNVEQPGNQTKGGEENAKQGDKETVQMIQGARDDEHQDNTVTIDGEALNNTDMRGASNVAEEIGESQGNVNPDAELSGIANFIIDVPAEGIRALQEGVEKQIGEVRFELELHPGMLLQSNCNASGRQTINQDTASTSTNVTTEDPHPEMYIVEGEPCENKTPDKKKESQDSKKRRNSGLHYTSRHSGKVVSGRLDKPLGPRCDPEKSRCSERSLMCFNLSDEQRSQMRSAFYGTGDLQSQREWIARYTSVESTKVKTEGSRRNTTMKYFLPRLTDVNFTDSPQIAVCKKMFLGTLGISEQMVRTTYDKMSNEGFLERDQRGGRPEILKAKDNCLKKEVEAHINKFPRMESHYCRSTSSYEYLSPDLNISTMYDLYKTEKPRGASRQYYSKVFQNMKLKFHHPKKDQCGVCGNFHEATSEEEKAELRPAYDKHIAEKTKVREIKAECKEISRGNPNIVTAAFDLQQVIYLPRSNRGDIFYKRRLACYNFTVFDIGTRDGFCYISHEAITKRGSNEIASCLFHFLTSKDREGATVINFFSDGCPGQNKNTIIPTMLLWFVNHSSNIHTITLYFFESNHGQSEGDSMHSVIERKLQKIGDIFLPSQLATLMRVARKTKAKTKNSPQKGRSPYTVHEVCTDEVLDWKSQSALLLRLRKSDDGTAINWKDFMAVRVMKETPEKVYIKMSHLDESFLPLSINQGRRRNPINPSDNDEPEPAYTEANHPKLTEEKFTDLMKLIDGPNPVIRHPDHVQFYRMLPH